MTKPGDLIESMFKDMGYNVKVVDCPPAGTQFPITPTKRKKPILIEDGICINQIAPTLQFMEDYKQFLPSVRWRKIANEAYHKSVIVGAKQKRMGKKPGCGDYLLTWEGGWGWIEVKTLTGKLLPSQKAFEKECLETGGKYSVVRNSDELREALKQWKILK